MASGNAEKYGYDNCIQLSIDNQWDVPSQPDCVALYALCKSAELQVHLKIWKLAQGNPKYNENSHEIRDIELIYPTIALYMTGNDWSAGYPQPYR